MEKEIFQPCFDDERFAKIIAGWVGRVGMPSKIFQPTIPDSQGQLSSDDLSYRVYFVIGVVIVMNSNTYPNEL